LYVGVLRRERSVTDILERVLFGGVVVISEGAHLPQNSASGETWLEISISGIQVVRVSVGGSTYPLISDEDEPG
jgi:hypothetical protein